MRRITGNLAAVSCAIILCCAYSVLAQATTQPLSEDQKIERLIRTVDELKDATFIRNGSEYDCHAAAKHMRDKWDYGKKQIHTAGEFIDKAASKSSASGKPYLIRFKDGREIESGAFLRDELKKLEGGDSPPSR
jgi:hypothetical protein